MHLFFLKSIFKKLSIFMTSLPSQGFDWPLQVLSRKIHIKFSFHQIFIRGTMRKWTTEQQLILRLDGFSFGCKWLLFMGSWFLGNLAAVWVLFLETIHIVLMYTCVKHYKKTSPFRVGTKENYQETR